MIVALRAMDPAELDSAPVVPREKGALRAALHYVRATPSLRVPLLMMALVGMLSFNFLVILPLLARFSFDKPASGYAALMIAMGIGSVLGALAAGARGRVSNRLLVLSSALFGVLIFLLAISPTIELAAIVLVPLGAASVTFAAGVNSALQLAVSPEMRGRVMALYSMVFLGSTPIGGPLAGWLSETWSPRIALLVGAAAALVAAVAARAAFARRAEATSPAAGSDSSRQCHQRRSSHSGSSRGTAGGSPPRSRRAEPLRARS
jgi:MFS family permease